MIKGTIATPDYYGKVCSIERPTSVRPYDTLIHKYSGQPHTVVAVTLVIGDTHKSMYKMKSTAGTYERFCDFDTLKRFYWKKG